ncbi:hypothetical protein ACIGB8_14745 [Promicromonospora sukumoe]|uniref:hypothetical protein n=1 Tax=Promicromonospora sukumoe TaxID=88382 RepID=UPI0037CC1C64
MAESDEKPTCFIAMPITTQPEHVDRYDDDEDHWGHVMGSLFEKAIENAGFRPIRPAAKGAHLIHAQIIQHLSTASLVLVDLSAHNPNVFFELGVRTSLDLPIALVVDEHTNIPFDTSGINTYAYNSRLRGWELEEQRDALTRHISDSYASCKGKNPLWQQFGLNIKAFEPDSDESPREAKLDLIMGQLARLQSQVENDHLTSGLVTQARLEEEGGTWYTAHTQGAPRRNSPVDHVADEVRKVLLDGKRTLGIHKISPTLLEVGADDLTPPELSSIRRIEQSSGVKITIRSTADMWFHENTAALDDRRRREHSEGTS